MMASIVTKDVRTTTAKNLALIRRECNVRTQTVAASEVRLKVPLSEVPANHEWRLPLLVKLLKQRKEKFQQETILISAVIDSLCSS